MRKRIAQKRKVPYYLIVEDGHYSSSRKAREKFRRLRLRIQHMRGAKYLGSGRDRHTFLLPSGKYVVKVPRHFFGIESNASEAKNETIDEKHLPRRRMAGDYLVMEYVDTNWKKVNKHKDRHAPWVEGLYDGPQIGITKTGRLVVYDFSDE